MFFRSCKKNLAVTEDDRTVLSFFLRNGEAGAQDEVIAVDDNVNEDIAAAAQSDEDNSEDSDTEDQEETDTDKSDEEEEEDSEDNEVFWVRHATT